MTGNNIKVTDFSDRRMMCLSCAGLSWTRLNALRKTGLSAPLSMVPAAAGIFCPCENSPRSVELNRFPINKLARFWYNVSSRLETSSFQPNAYRALARVGEKRNRGFHGTEKDKARQLTH